uniref:F-box domain-containing protein n=1 Tax=Lutzomyia longipalpis TaxID=7200 RepID=A0A1B0CGF4_LUTLO
MEGDNTDVETAKMEMQSKEEQHGNPENLISPFKTTFLDLPLMDLMPIIAQYLEPQDLFALRCTSHYCKHVVDDVGFTYLGIVDLTYSGCGWWTYSKYFDRPGERKYNSRIAIRERIMQKCRKARKLKVAKDWITNDLMYEFLKNNPSLEEFELDESSPISNEALKPLLNCKNLTVLKVPYSQCGDNEFLRSLSQHNNHLLKIDFEASSCRTSYSPQVIKEFISKQPHLQYIRLPYVDDYDVNHEIIRTIVRVCKDLKIIELPGWRRFGDDEPLIWLADGCKKLTDICLENVDWIVDEQIVLYMMNKGIIFRWELGSNWPDDEFYVFRVF